MKYFRITLILLILTGLSVAGELTLTRNGVNPMNIHIKGNTISEQAGNISLYIYFRDDGITTLDTNGIDDSQLVTTWAWGSTLRSWQLETGTWSKEGHTFTRRLYYDNVGVFSLNDDWTTGGIDALVCHFSAIGSGHAYVEINGPDGLADWSGTGHEVTLQSINTNNAPLITSADSIAIEENITEILTITVEDSDGDNLTFSKSGGSDSSLFSIHETSGLLSFKSGRDFENPTDTNGDGVYEVRITATDDGINNLTDHQVIKVKVLETDDPPIVANPISNITVAEDAADSTLLITHLFSDDDDDDSAIIKSIHNNTDSTLVIATITNDTLTLAFQPDQNGTATVTIRGTSDGKSVNTDFLVMVNPISDPLVIADSIPDITVNEDAQSTKIDLNSIFIDPDVAGSTVVKTILSNSNDSLIACSIENDTLILDYQGNQNGISTLRLSAESQGDMVADEFLITVNPVNDPPTSINHAVMIKNYNTYRFQPVNFYFTDVEGDSFAGVWFGSVLDQDNLVYDGIEAKKDTTYFDITKLTYTPDPEMEEGNYIIFTFKVRDSGGEFSEDFYNMMITIRSIEDPSDEDDPPVVVLPVEDLMVAEDAGNKIILLTSVFTDPDNDDLAMVKTVHSNSNSSILSTQLSGDTLVLDFLDNQYGSTNITLRALSNGRTADDIFTVTIDPVNDGPAGRNEEITFDEDAAYTFRPEDFNYNDIESHDFAGIKIITTESRGDLEYDGLDVVYSNDYPDVTKLVFYPEKDSTGSPYATFNFRLLDEEGGRSIPFYTMTLHVRALEDPPIVANPVSNIVVDEDAPAKFIDLRNVFTDTDNTDSLITKSLLSNSNDSLLSVTVGGDSLLLDFLPNQYGTSEVALRGTSNGKFADDIFTIEVRPVNDAPFAATGHIITDEDAAYNFQTADFHYNDIEKDAFAGIKIITPETAGELSFDGAGVFANTEYTDVTKLLFLPASDATGSPYASFTYHVKDAQGALSDSVYRMDITVLNVNDKPEFLATLPDTAIFENTCLEFHFEAFDPDRDSLQYLLNATKIETGSPYTAMKLDSVTGFFKWAATYEDAGTYRVLVHISDRNLVTTDSLQIQVRNVNRSPEFTKVLPDTILRDDSNFSFTYEAKDPDEEGLVFGLVHFIDSITISQEGLLNWTLWPAMANQYTIAVFVTDGTDTARTSADITIHKVTVAIDEELGLPDQFELGQNYPNPFNPSTTIRYGLPKGAHVNISVFDMRGNRLETLVNENQEAGYHRVHWEADPYATGIYFYRIIAGDFVQIRKCILIK
ncbi:MAG: T9SS type A sorting domain-containing protein [Candidatus Marinimicrobia bacterium]|nr:T9SS type A sorting domain-containing protein [Candidatus Neomarinimicrobiota bacterium]